MNPHPSKTKQEHYVPIQLYMYINSRLQVWLADSLCEQFGPSVTASFCPSQFFPRGKNGQAHSFPGKKTNRIRPARMNGILYEGLIRAQTVCKVDQQGTPAGEEFVDVSVC